MLKQVISAHFGLMLGLFGSYLSPLHTPDWQTWYNSEWKYLLTAAPISSAPFSHCESISVAFVNPEMSAKSVAP